MILVTCGTEQFQFNRLIHMAVGLLHRFPNQRLVIQYGSSTFTPPLNPPHTLFDFTSEEEFRKLVEEADLIISHCGEGSLLLLQEYKKPYILVPRRGDLGEHVDDHQLELASVLREQDIPVADTDFELYRLATSPTFVPFTYNSKALATQIKDLPLELSSYLLVCSSGGHFKALREISQYLPFDISWVTFRNKTTINELELEQVRWAYQPTNRNIPNAVKNLVLAYSVVKELNPSVLLSTGAGVAVPFIIVAKLSGCKTIFVESITRVQDLSLSAKMLVKLNAIDYLIVQSDQLKAKYPQSILVK